MANYKLSVLAKEDLIKIHEYGTRNFGKERAITRYITHIRTHRPFQYLFNLNRFGALLNTKKMQSVVPTTNPLNIHS